MGLQEAEQLVIELAAGRVGTGSSSFKISEVQQELNIPPHLVYLVGILIAEEDYQRWKEHKPQVKNIDGTNTSNYFSPVREERFTALQKQYWTFVNNNASANSEEQHQPSSLLSSMNYRLSTRVCPSKEQQAVVKRDLLKECEKLESLSNQAIEALLREESSSDASIKNNKIGKKNKKKKYKQQHQKLAATKIPLEEKDKEEGKKVNTLEKIGTVEETSWVEIKKKEHGEVTGNTAVNSLDPDGGGEEGNIKSSSDWSSTILVNLENESGMPMKKDETPMLLCTTTQNIKNNDNPATSDHDDTNADPYTEKIDTLINNLSSPLPPNSNDMSRLNTSTSDHHSLHHAATNNLQLAKQVRRVADLEQNLTDANRQLTEERTAHAKLLRKEKERYEDLIQALQLRLYISENKLRTYEDALEKHVQAVYTISSSGITKKNEEERIPSSPSLISKVLENNKGNNKTGDHIW